MSEKEIALVDNYIKAGSDLMDHYETVTVAGFCIRSELTFNEFLESLFEQYDRYNTN